MSGGVTAALFTTARETPAWLTGLGLEVRTAEPGDRVALRTCDIALIDAATTDPLPLARRVRAAEPNLHIMIVAEADGVAALERALLFTPGAGEVWIAAREALDRVQLERGAGITRTRRSYEGRRTGIEAAVASLTERRALPQPYISDAYLAALLQVLPDPVLSLDEDGRIESWSPAAAGALLVEPSARGRRLAHVMRARDPAALEDLLQRGRRDTVRGEVGWVRSDGADRIADVTVTPVDVAGQAIRAVVVRDVTEERLAQHTLEEQAAELEAQTIELGAQAEELKRQRDELERLAAERMHVLDEMREVVASRSRFYASMSHEIRTPINAILGYNDLLLAGIYGELDPKQVEGLQRSQAAARHLRELVNDVLDLSKIESGKVEVVEEEVPLGELVREVVATMAPVAEEQEATIGCDVDGAPVIVTDPRRVRQILLNLLSNAVKFGSGRPVEVRSGVRGEGWVFVEVRDHGPGIEPDQLERIFEEFVQLESIQQGGTGLGLAISKRLAIALGGTIAAASSPGAGSTFTLTLPLRR